MIPYSKTLQATVDAGYANCIRLPAPMRGIVTRLVVKDKSGGSDGFSFNLYDRADACAAYESSLLGSSYVLVATVLPQSYYNNNETQIDFENELLDPAMHKLQATQTITAGNVVSEQFDIVLPYQNKDEGGLYERKQSALYLELSPEGTGTKIFQVAYTITQAGYR